MVEESLRDGGAVVDDSRRELGVVLSYLVGRQLRAGELIEALGVSRSAYYAARDEGRLVTADNLLKLAKTLRLNPVDLMLRFGLITPESVRQSADRLGPAGATPAGRPSISQLQPLPDVPPI